MQPVLAKTTDHIEVEGYHDGLEGHCGIVHPMLTSEKAFFFGIPKGKKKGSTAGRSKLTKSLRKLKDGRDSRGIIIGTRTNLTILAFSAESNMIEVGPNDNHLPRQLRVISRQDPQNVTKPVPERLKVIALHTGRGYLQLSKLLPNPRCCLLSCGSTRLPTLEIGMS
jgi:hypothetical protein